jgi:hypothetical protein
MGKILGKGVTFGFCMSVRQSGATREAGAKREQVILYLGKLKRQKQ